MSSPLNLQDFLYDLPSERIAQQPAADRACSKLLVYGSNYSIIDTLFKNIGEFLPENCLLILNETKVFPSRLLGNRKSGGKVEIFLLESIENCSKSRWSAFIKPLKKLRPQEPLFFEPDLVGKFIGKGEGDATAIVEFNKSDSELAIWLQENGIVPLPPYIHRSNPEKASKSVDTRQYQTVYAENSGSVAAPTAGLHFDQSVLTSLKAKGIKIAPITLHVGAGTFMPVKTEDISLHKMHTERYFVPSETSDHIEDFRNNNKPIFCIGTTSFRCLESLRIMSEKKGCSIKELSNCWLETNLFVRPKNNKDLYQDHFFSGIITNFHQPGSTLLMLISSLIGFDEAKTLYKHALDNNYRFLSYGDSSLLNFKRDL